MYEILKSNYSKRIEAIIGYAEEKETCRSRYLVEYFGQKDSQDCGYCDVCRSKKSGVRDASSDAGKAEEAIRKSLIEFISIEKKGVYSLQDIKDRFFLPGSKFGPDELLGALRELIDSGVVPKYF